MARASTAARKRYHSPTIVGTDHGEHAVLLVVHRFLEIDSHVQKLASRRGEDNALDAALVAWHAWLSAVIAQPAHSVMAAQAKATCLLPALRCLLGNYEQDIPEHAELRLALSLAADVAALEG